VARTRYQAGTDSIPWQALPAAAMRAVLSEGYTRTEFRHDVLAGAVVGVVALPLSMALSIAVGAPPQNGLYTAIVAGFLVALLGGSRTQVTGPTAAFVVILAPIYARFGLPGLLVSGMLAGVILIVMGLLRLGRFIEFIPYPVTTGFTAGIGTVIGVMQVKDLLGLRIEGNPEHFLERVIAMARAAGTVAWPEVTIAAITFTILLAWPRLVRRVPAPLVALPAAAVSALLLPLVWHGFHVATIASTFETTVRGHVVHGIPQMPPLPVLPWMATGHRHAFPLDVSAVQLILPGAFTIAMLGAIESLLSAVVADGLARTKHDPDAELIALGVGNVVTPFFGGIPATGAIARTATSVRAGARSPVASMIHALVVLAAMLALAPLIGYLPMASLAALLLLVAWNMSEVKHVRRILRIAPTSDVIVLLTCYGLTVFFDMVMAVSVGVGLAALLFMRRMIEVADARLSEGDHPDLSRPLPTGVFVYDIMGPLFFGAAEKAMATLNQIAGRARVVILRMEHVPAIDATGLVALESALESLAGQKALAVFTGLRAQPLQVLQQAGIVEREGSLRICRDINEAVEAAERHIGPKIRLRADAGSSWRPSGM
jgi:sulfate permease, SulP family